ncbi:MAG: hypothetical protein PVS3B3_23920 [Ktedonobacteraceae bacterium]
MTGLATVMLAHLLSKPTDVYPRPSAIQTYGCVSSPIYYPNLRMFILALLLALLHYTRQSRLAGE